MTPCRSCGSNAVELFYETGPVPVHSCLMVSTREAALKFPRGSLALGFCGDCGFIMNTRFDPARLSYTPEYEETQGFSERFRRFATDLCADQIEKYGLRGKVLLEIGCGKGEFLSQMCAMGNNRGIGIDPSYRPERTDAETAARIQFIQELYSEKFGDLKADYVCCRHTLEHIPDVREFVGMIRRSLDRRPDTIVFFEVPDVGRVLTEHAFWDIYYEHCSYFTLGSLARLFRACGFQILDLHKVFDDQYLVIEARPGTDGKRFEIEEPVEKTRVDIELFKSWVADRLDGLRGQLDRFRSAGRRAVVWGSGSKAVSYLTTLEIRDELEYVVDINPHKHGKYLAGSGHEIVSPEFLRRYRPDAVIVMNPIYKEEIQADLERLGVRAELFLI
ncbi:MAG: methyltransferase domain-containing protein [Planctomycetes bacterium]|nr:methyltransferase domain-containing protein [Planctomycetota bacterium]